MATLLRELDAGQSRESVVRDILKTPEMGAAEATGLYQAMLGRAPTATEQAQVVSEVRAGVDERRIFLRLAATPDFASVAGGTHAGFVSALYESLAGSQPTAAEAAPWVAMFDGGASQARVARAIINSPAVVSTMAQQTLSVNRSWGGHSALAKAVRIVQRKGGPAELVARVYGSRSYYDVAVQAGAMSQVTTTVEAPMAPGSATAALAILSDHPLGLPFAPTLDFGTSWIRLDQPADGYSFNSGDVLGAAPDGSIWASNEGNVYRYVPGTSGSLPAWSSVFDFYKPGISSIAPVSKDLVWVIFQQINPAVPELSMALLWAINGDGEPVSQSEITGPVVYNKVSVAPDGTQMVSYTDGSLTVQYPGQSAAAPLSLPSGDVLQSFAAGSQSSLWVVATRAGTPGTIVLHDVAGTWQQDPVVAGAARHADLGRRGRHGLGLERDHDRRSVRHERHLEGAGQVDPDPAGLAQRRGRDLAVSLRLPAGRRQPADALGGRDGPAGGPHPADGPGPAPGVSGDLRLSPGDQPAGDPGRLHQRAAVTEHPGRRRQAAGHAPAGGHPRRHLAGREVQVLLELETVPQVYAIFDLMQQVRDGIQASNNTVLPGIESLVSTGVEPIQSSDTITLVLEGVIEAVLWGAAASSGGGVALSVLASAFGSAISSITGTANPNSNTALQLQYSQLTDTLSTMYSLADQQNATYEQSIFSDWGRLSAVGCR